MCGILFTTDEKISDTDFVSGLEAMRHRGPDAALCTKLVPGARLGHNRLKIIDLDDRSN